MKIFFQFYLRLSIIPILLVFFLSNVTIAQDKKVAKRLNVAVLDLEISGGIPEIYQKTLSDRLRLELLNTGRFNVIERNAMEEVLGEQGFQMSGCTSDECAVEVGRLLGVQGIIAGSIGKVGNTHSIILRHINVETGSIVNSKGVDCSCPIDEVLSTKIGETARLLAGLEGQTATSVSGEGDLLIKSTPSGAIVYLDDQKLKGLTPFAVEKLTKGKHTLRLERGDLVGSTTVDIIPGQINRVEVPMEVGGEIYITCNIEAADLVVNDTKQKPGFPANLQKLTPGTYEIEVTLPGYTVFKRSVLMKPEQKVEVKAELKRQQGTINFDRLPKGTIITLDDQKIGSAPIPDKLVDAGWHIINISRKGYTGSMDKDIEVKVDETFVVEFDLQKIKKQAALEKQEGKINFRRLPKGTVVTLDDRKIGSTPLSDRTVDAGWHIVKISRNGYTGSIDKDIEVLEDETFVVEYDLKRIKKRVGGASALPKSLLWAGWGQMSIGRKVPGIIYAIGEAGAVGFLVVSTMSYNKSVNDYNDARDAYDNEPLGSLNFDQLYDDRVKAHDDSESAKGMVAVAGGIAGALYVWNIIDALIFKGDGSGVAFNDDTGTADINFATIGDSQGKPAIGISLGITFGSTGRTER
ncbi:MAG: PEGA domain-containing protein [Candidatus Electryonea clarkiae]|nr:PEGA domain-containing protein [Candidatus Electryonea clarkiae]MDP8285348.1 PEGA domain-containing protein [Candidatus Electryonea clarkiae]